MSKREFARGLQVETATYQQDLPHEFASEGAGSQVCSVCTSASSDARHVSWERAHLAERERAAADDRGIQREFG